MCIRDSYKIMHDLAASGITMNAQIVVCPGLNDGKVLERSLDDLILLYPYVQSISVVPVGLTKHRQGLYPLEPVSYTHLDVYKRQTLQRSCSRETIAADSALTAMP